MAGHRGTSQAAGGGPRRARGPAARAAVPPPPSTPGRSWSRSCGWPTRPRSAPVVWVTDSLVVRVLDRLTLCRWANRPATNRRSRPMCWWWLLKDRYRCSFRSAEEGERHHRQPPARGARRRQRPRHGVDSRWPVHRWDRTATTPRRRRRTRSASTASGSTASGDQRPVPALRRGHRLRDDRRAARRPGRVSRRRPGHAGAGFGGVHAAVGAGGPARPRTYWWTYVPGADWRHPRGPGSSLRGRRSSGGPCRLRRRVAYAEWAGKRSADRGGVGVRRARRAGRRRVRLGRRAHPGRQAHGQHLAGRVPVREPALDGYERHLAGRGVPAQRLRPVRHDRQRLGVDGRLVRAPALAADAPACCAHRRRAQPGRRRGADSVEPGQSACASRAR